MDITAALLRLRDAEYKAFQERLLPTVAPERILGVRVPALRTLAKDPRPDWAAFLAAPQHRYYEEDMLHALRIAGNRDFERCIREVNDFLPRLDNWAVCDSLRPACFRRQRPRLAREIGFWLASEQPYTQRFGIEMLMLHFLEEDFREEYLSRVAALRSGEYYVNMMIAWYFATALALQWDSALPYLREGRLAAWVHGKCIRKALESRRLSPEQKELLRSLPSGGGQ